MPTYSCQYSSEGSRESLKLLNLPAFVEVEFQQHGGKTIGTHSRSASWKDTYARWLTELYVYKDRFHKFKIVTSDMSAARAKGSAWLINNAETYDLFMSKLNSHIAEFAIASTQSKAKPKSWLPLIISHLVS